MGKIVLDGELRAKLNGLSEKMEVRDEDGEVVGVFLPVEHYKTLLQNLDIPYSREEIEQFKQSGGGCSLADIWKRLGVQ